MENCYDILSAFLTLDPLEVTDNYTFDFVSNQLKDSSLQKHMDYLLDTCIVEESEFPLIIWV